MAAELCTTGGEADEMYIPTKTINGPHPTEAKNVLLVDPELVRVSLHKDSLVLCPST